MIEYLLANMWQLWAVVAVVGLILEMTSGDFFIMCVAIGAIGAAIVVPFSNIYGQLAVFGLVTLFSLFQVRPIALRYLHRKGEERVSNADALIAVLARPSKRKELDMLLLTVTCGKLFHKMMKRSKKVCA